MKAALKAVLTVEGPPYLLTHNAYQHLRAEFAGDAAAAWRWLAQRVKYGSRPVFVNIEFDDDTSRTVALAPLGWTHERLAGYVAGMHETLEQEYGEISRWWNPDEVAS